MPSKEELKQLYLTKEDNEILNVYYNQSDYTPEAVEAVNEILSERGGAENWIKEKEQKALKQQEVLKTQQQIFLALKAGQDVNPSIYASEKLDIEEIMQIIAQEKRAVEAVIKDEKITTGTVTKGIIGGAIAAVAGGIVFGLSLIHSGKVFFILLAGLWIVAFALVKGFTGKSGNNVAVVVISVVSAVIAAMLGFLLYSIVGYQQ